MKVNFETTIPTSSSAQLLKSNLCPDVLVVVGSVCGHFITEWRTQAEENEDNEENKDNNNEEEEDGE